VQKLENSIIMTITDNGAGISEEVAQQIFQPHFTTKSSGSGIGLAMVKQIVENHHGHIHFTTQIGVGSCFIVEITA
jgi:two-component system nitrogen regulation sensor histidine kinase NtrY